MTIRKTGAVTGEVLGVESPETQAEPEAWPEGEQAAQVGRRVEAFLDDPSAGARRSRPERLPQGGQPAPDGDDD